MFEKIGGVTLNYQFYEGQDLYSDGPVEDQILEICKAGRQEEALEANSAWPILYHFSPIRQDILDWYPIDKDASVLEIGAGCGAITKVLSRKAKRVVCIELSKKRSMINAYQNRDSDNVEIYVGKYEDIKLNEKFDYITLIGVFEYAAYYTSADNPYGTMLEQIKEMLKPEGKLLIAIENRMGLKYLNGANEDHTGVRFDGVHNYKNKNGARTFTRAELARLLAKAGLPEYKFYYPMPDYKLPYCILSDEYESNTGAFQGYDTVYDSIRYEFFNEDAVWDTLHRDNMAGYFANSLFVEAGFKEDFANVCYARYSWHRDKPYRIKTLLVNGGNERYVLKANLQPEGSQYMESFFAKYDLIADSYRHMTVVPPERTPDGVKFPYIEGKTVHNMLLDYQYSKNELLEKIDFYLDRVLSFQDGYLVDFQLTDEFCDVFGSIDFDGVPAVKVANIDCLFENIIEKDGRLYCFDYEWTFPFAVPVFYLKFRVLVRWYIAVKNYLPFESVEWFLLQSGLSPREINAAQDMEESFLRQVLKKDAAYMGQYAKTTIHFGDYEDAFTMLSKEKEALQGERESLLEENKSLGDKLARHLENEERLRKAIKRLKEK